ncbi:Alpha/Beta hydrolase protein [Aspergillus tetrazonus]
MDPASTTAALISIGTHSLSCSITGPTPHDLSDPLVVVFPGSGNVASSYVAAERLLRPFTRTLLYDRSGLGRSENISTDTPLLLVAHSYGAMFAREFLHLYPERVTGMVLVDAWTERASEHFDVPDRNIVAVMGDLSYVRATGLRSQTVLGDEELRVRAKEIIASYRAAAAKAASFYEVCETLKRKDQFQTQVLGIGRSCCRKWHGRTRATFCSLLDRWEGIDKDLQEEQLQLSSNTHFVRLNECGHNVHLVRPEVITQEVGWVRDRVKAASNRCGQLCYSSLN